jgi:hypothetical protein
MIRKLQELAMLTGVVAAVCVLPLHAASVSVGTCLPALPHFATIQAAINASPQGGTVMVCPGTYSEQISIYHPLTLKGVDSNGSNLAVITMPSGGVGTQVWVQATNVNISDLVIDGSNNGATTCGQGPNGITYYGSSGTINHVAIRNEVPSGPGLTGCFDGDGVYVAANNTVASNVTIINSSIHAFQRNGVEVNGRGANAKIQSNSIGGNTVGPAGNGVAIWFGATGTVSSNSIINVLEPVAYPNQFGAGYGIIVQCSQGVTISGNTIGDTQAAIVVSSWFCSAESGNGDSNTIQSNKISQTHIFDAVYVCGNYNLVQNNTLNSTSEAGIRFDSTCDNPGTSGYNNQFSGNIVTEACTTSLVDPALAGANTIGSNSSFGVAYDQLFGTTQVGGFCTGAQAPSKAPRYPSVPNRPSRKDGPPPPVVRVATK